MPEISVVIPAWNLDAELREAYASVRAQDVDVEIIVVDNASDTPLPRLDGARYVRTPRRVSVGAARNAGLRLVTTPLVYFQDADDVMPPGTLRRLLDELTRHPEAILANGLIEAWEPTSGARTHHFPRRWTLPLSRSELARRTLLPSLEAAIHCIPMGTSLVRTSTVRRAGGYPDLSWGEDAALMARLVQLGPIRVTDHCCKWYRAQVARPTLGSASQMDWRARFRAMQAVRRALIRSDTSGAWEYVLFPVVLAAHAYTLTKYRVARRPERQLRVFGLGEPGR